MEKSIQNSATVSLVNTGVFHEVSNLMKRSLDHRLTYAHITGLHSVLIQIDNTVLILASDILWHICHFDIKTKFPAESIDRQETFRIGKLSVQIDILCLHSLTLIGKSFSAFITLFTLEVFIVENGLDDFIVSGFLCFPGPLIFFCLKPLLFFDSGLLGSLLFRFDLRLFSGTISVFLGNHLLCFGTDLGTDILLGLLIGSLGILMRSLCVLKALLVFLFDSQLMLMFLGSMDQIIDSSRSRFSAIADCFIRSGDTFGGSDNNVVALHGLRGLVLAAAMELVHTTEEYTTVAELARSAELTLKLMTMEDAP